MKTLFSLLIILFFLGNVPQANAEVKHALASAALAQASLPQAPDTRAHVLRAYLEQYNSPLAASATTFVQAADENNLDWRLVAAISGVESTYGHQIPYGTYNAWGWGIYGDNMIYFESFDEGIITISKALREKYINKWGAQDVYEIGRFYAASPTWAQRVDAFMNRMEKFSYVNQLDTLPISL